MSGRGEKNQLRQLMSNLHEMLRILGEGKFTNTQNLNLHSQSRWMSLSI